MSVHHLDNLVWVWNTNAPRSDAVPYAGFYPGHDVVDILAADVYADAAPRHWRSAASGLVDTVNDEKRDSLAWLISYAKEICHLMI